MSAPTPIKSTPHAVDRNFGVESFKFNRWSCELDETQTLEDALNPSFWSGQVEKIMGHNKTNPRGRGDIIALRQISTGLYVELLVLEVGTGFIKVEPIREFQPKDVTISDTSPLTTRWNVGKRKHEVVRKVDNQVMAADFQTKQSAADWIADHMKKLAA